ncbi:MAG TPA: hypothetical protein VK009_05230 [Chloroflexota bacterium]|nr:hypothetical protein [Chloroflexota bacterium]
MICWNVYRFMDAFKSAHPEEYEDVRTLANDLGPTDLVPRTPKSLKLLV